MEYKNGEQYHNSYMSIILALQKYTDAQNNADNIGTAI